MPFFNNLRLTATGIASTSLIIMTALLPTGTQAATPTPPQAANAAAPTPSTAASTANVTSPATAPNPTAPKTTTQTSSTQTTQPVKTTATPTPTPTTTAKLLANAVKATSTAVKATTAPESKTSPWRRPKPTPTKSSTSTPTTTSTPSNNPTPTPSSSSSSSPTATSTPTQTTTTQTTTTDPNAMPTGDLPGWTQTYTQDFNTNAAIGQFSTIYGSKLLGYNGFTDTSGNGTYTPNQVLSATSGNMDYYIHSSGGKYLTAAPTPTGYTGQLYGKWSIRFRSDTIPGYKLAFLLWPDSDQWSDGEIDFPEGELGSSIGAYSHNVLGTPSTNAFAWTTGANMNTWHTLSIEWTPTHLTYTLDGVSKTTTDKSAIPTKPMHFVMQAETDLNGVKPATSAAGHIQVDWITIYKYTP